MMGASMAAMQQQQRMLAPMALASNDWNEQKAIAVGNTEEQPGGAGKEYVPAAAAHTPSLAHPLSPSPSPVMCSLLGCMRTNTCYET